MRASAVLHQYQREKNDKGDIIANEFDYEYARFVFTQLKNLEAQMLSKDEEEVLNILENAKTPLSIKEISEQFKTHTSRWIYDNIDNWKSRGIIGETYEYDTDANKKILKIYSKLGDIDQILPKKLVLNGFEEGFQNQKQEGFEGFEGFEEIKKIIEQIREQQGLSLSIPEIVQNQHNLSVDGCEIPFQNHQNQDSLHEKLNKVFAILQEHPEDNYKEIKEILGEDGIEEAVTRGVLYERALGRTFEKGKG
jgi:hypothetical protein